MKFRSKKAKARYLKNLEDDTFNSGSQAVSIVAKQKQGRKWEFKNPGGKYTSKARRLDADGNVTATLTKRG